MVKKVSWYTNPQVPQIVTRYKDIWTQMNRTSMIRDINVESMFVFFGVNIPKSVPVQHGDSDSSVTTRIFLIYIFNNVQFPSMVSWSPEGEVQQFSLSVNRNIPEINVQILKFFEAYIQQLIIFSFQVNQVDHPKVKYNNSV